MSAALDLVKTLTLAGVEFATDGVRVRWRNGKGRMTPEVVSILAAERQAVIAFLTGKPREQERDLDAEQQTPDETSYAARPKPDPDLYADALRLHGPMSYGMAARRLGWGGTRAGQAEAALREMGRIEFNTLGRAMLMETDEQRVPGKEEQG